MSKANIYQTAVYVTVFSVVEKFLGFLYRIILSRTLGSEEWDSTNWPFPSSRY